MAKAKKTGYWGLSTVYTRKEQAEKRRKKGQRIVKVRPKTYGGKPFKVYGKKYVYGIKNVKKKR